MFFKNKHPHRGMGHGLGSGWSHGMGHGRARVGRGGGRRRLFDGASLRMILLRLIEQQPRHGYDLIREIEELSGGVYAPSPGVIYPTLTMLAEMGQIEEVVTEGSRKQFAITTEGSTHLAKNRDAVEEVMERLSTLAADDTTADRTPIIRALDNLTSVLRHRLSREGADMTNIHAATALIDDAAQKIERL
ncbi:MAG: PadR family transcriptional regulator [Sphingorhabdus sp.]